MNNGDDLNVLLGLFGFLVPMALAMSARSLPMYAGLEAFPGRILQPSSVIYLLTLDAIRHSFAVGFITLLICGISVRMLLGFSGQQIVSSALVHTTFWLGNAAALLQSARCLRLC